MPQLDGEPITIAFNPQFLLDGLGAIDAPTAGPVVHDVDQARRPDRRARATADGGRELPLPAHAGPPLGLTVHVAHLSLTDFRSYAGVELPLDPGVTSFVGPNGQGKTNLVEAIGYVATRCAAIGSPPTPRWCGRAPSARSSGSRSCATTAPRSSRSRSTRDAPTAPASTGPRCRAPARSLGLLRTVLFAPEDLALVKGDPSERRRFLDDLLVARAPRLAGVRADYDRSSSSATPAEVGRAWRRGPAAARDLSHARRLGLPPRHRWAASCWPRGSPSSPTCEPLVGEVLRRRSHRRRPRRR